MSSDLGLVGLPRLACIGYLALLFWGLWDEGELKIVIRLLFVVFLSLCPICFPGLSGFVC